MLLSSFYCSWVILECHVYPGSMIVSIDEALVGELVVAFGGLSGAYPVDWYANSITEIYDMYIL